MRTDHNRIKLTTPKMTALYLRAIEGLSYTEIAKRTHSTYNAARQRVVGAIDIIQAAREQELRLCK